VRVEQVRRPGHILAHLTVSVLIIRY
jgi:hypothetical protein